MSCVIYNSKIPIDILQSSDLVHSSTFMLLNILLVNKFLVTKFIIPYYKEQN